MSCRIDLFSSLRVRRLSSTLFILIEEVSSKRLLCSSPSLVMYAIYAFVIFCFPIRLICFWPFNFAVYFNLMIYCSPLYEIDWVSVLQQYALILWLHPIRFICLIDSCTSVLWLNMLGFLVLILALLFVNFLVFLWILPIASDKFLFSSFSLSSLLIII